MRTMMQVELDTAASNRLIENGTIGEVLDRVLGSLKPEAAYFYAQGGHRAFTLVVDIPDPTYIPTFAEPFWLELNATVAMNPCMNADELKAGLARLH